MIDETKLTVCDKLVLAANQLELSGKRPFTAEDLVVAAWQRFPRTFGLRGHDGEKGVPAYPDSNRVFAEIMGRKPIRHRGLLVKVGEKLYELTASGRALANRLEAADVASYKGAEVPGGKMTLSREVKAEFERLLQSRAVGKYQAGDPSSITFHDACKFWKITPSSYAVELAGQFSKTKDIIDAVAQAIEGGGTQLSTGGAVVTMSGIELLRKVDEYLKRAFAEELITIERRIDQRKV